jgi:hypothetical protein
MVAPTGRVIQIRQLAGGNPPTSRLVAIQLGYREDRADFDPAFCRARKKGGFDQCGRRPARGAVVCGQHGGGHRVRQQNGSRLSPQEAGLLSGLARRIKRDGRIDLTQVPSVAPWLQDRAQELREHPEQLDLQEDVVQLTAMRDLLLSQQLDIEPEDFVRLLAMVVQVKSTALKAKFVLETPTMVPSVRVKSMISTLVDLLRRFTPEERLPEVARELRLLSNHDVDT